ANGKPIIVPSQDMVLGLYYLSMERQEKTPEFVTGADGKPIKGEDGKPVERLPVFSDITEVHQALAAKAVTLHTRIVSRVPQTDEQGKSYMKRVTTTPGRMLLGETLPKSHKVPFETVNRLLTKKEIGDVIDTVYRHTGQKETVLFADAIMALGFRHAFQAGISFGKDDMVIPAEKVTLVEETRALVKDYEQQYQDGLITQGEKYNKVVDAWARCGDRVADAMMKQISSKPIDEATGREKPINSIYMMAHSGARGSQAQMKQLAGMRGLMAKPSGEIIETPIISNFKEGLTVLEYFNSTHGARKGLADTALKTANSGYLTRRLVDVSQDCVVVEEDCGTEKFLKTTAIIEGGSVIVSLGERILGRTVADDVVDPKTGEIIVPAQTLLNEAEVARIEKAAVQEVKMRSPLVCETKQGVCSKCYGRDLARGTPVNAGEAVGVIAAQSIGEPGTQLTMRTFHIGGAAQVSEQSTLESPVDGTIKLKNLSVLQDSRGRLIATSRNGELAVVDADGRERSTHRIPFGATLLHKEGAKVAKGDRMAEWDPYTLPVITEKSGVVKYQDLIENVSLAETVDEATGITNKVVIDFRGSGSKKEYADLRPRITLLDDASGEAARYMLSVDAILSVSEGQRVEAGDVLARIPREAAKTRDITGGLPRVAELFEARKPKDNAVIARVDGRVEFGKDYKAKRRIILRPEDPSMEPVEYMVPKGKHITVQEGDFIKRGEYLIDGNPDPHDILDVLGIEPLAEYLCAEIQEVYRLQGVKINDKHIEVIVRQMLQKVEITKSGDTTLLVGEQVDREEMDEINAKVLAEKGEPAEGKPVLLGITKASLQTRSFISAASFQETTRVLTEAAVQGKVDTLNGLKENVIVGRLIPAGTGAAMNRLRVTATSRDAAIRASQREKQ
ncbi:MAG: DNA-directed RNA polymerase subunit beta', partial [Alphaproteobacteria bacterium]|nr:DNA-directed RNA polymerase subunit beta' [Alphaproteobacteria bacterium]